MSTTTLDDIDLSDHDAFRDAVPHEWFRRLRAEAPVFFNPEPDGPGFYAVTRYHDIRTVHRDTETFSSEIGGTSLEDLEPDQIEARKSMIDMDPPRHDELRKVVSKRFTPSAVKVWEDGVRTVTDRVLDAALQAASSTSSRRSPARSPCRCSPRSSGCRRRTAAWSSTSATASSATPTRSTPSRSPRSTGCCRSRARPRWS